MTTDSDIQEFIEQFKEDYQEDFDKEFMDTALTSLSEKDRKHFYVYNDYMVGGNLENLSEHLKLYKKYTEEYPEPITFAQYYPNIVRWEEVREKWITANQVSNEIIDYIDFQRVFEDIVEYDHYDHIDYGDLDDDMLMVQNNDLVKH